MIAWRMPALSLRVRLLIGAGLIAALALTAAGLAAWGSARSAAVIAEAAGAQARIELFAQLSARVGDYAVVAVESAGSGLPPEERAARLAVRADVVRASLEAVSQALARALEEAEDLTAAERMQRGGRSVGVARMQASFESLARVAPQAADPESLRAQLDTFATAFAPLVAEAIEAERRIGQRARAEAERQQALMRRLAGAIAAVTAALLAAYYVGLVRPLVGRLDRVAAAADTLGRGGFEGLPPADRRDELGLVFARFNRMAARLARGRAALERDRARLEQTVAERTAALSSANARLEQIDAERRRLFADIGHELRTPLTVILAETELAAHPATADAAELRGALATIRARARRLNRRIEDLLRVARSESGGIELDDRPFDLAQAAHDAIEDMEPLARRARVAIRADLPAARARGDRDWSRQVLSGVLDNAIRHSPEGATVTVALDREGDRLALSVTDEGDGVPAADQERVFERHVRGGRQEPGARLGFGVGLALARWIMERQGGSIALASPAPIPAPIPAHASPAPVPALTGAAAGGSAGAAAGRGPDPADPAARGGRGPGTRVTLTWASAAPPDPAAGRPEA